MAAADAVNEGGDLLVVYLHTPGRVEPEEVAIPPTALVEELVVGIEGDLIWIEEEENPLETRVMVIEARIGVGHHLFRGPCQEVELSVIAEGQRVARPFPPSTRVGTVARWAVEAFGLTDTDDLAIIDRRTGRTVEAGTHVGSLAQRGECSVALEVERRTPEVEIFVNSRPHIVPAGKISFDTVVKLAYPSPPPGQLIEYDVTYRHGPHDRPKGTLLEGHSVCVRKGMAFNVTATDKS